MTRDVFAAQCERGASHFAGLPVTSAILNWTADQLKHSEPSWWKGFAKAWEKRAFGSWADAWSLYLACLHFEALNDADCVLVPYFPSCGGTAEADPSAAVARFLSAPPQSFLENMKARARRPFFSGLAGLWASPALLFFQRRGLSYYVVEADAGAGLNLAADRLKKMKGFRSDLIDARVGLDAAPLVVEDIFQRRWLTACQLPDDGAGIASLDAAIDEVIAANKEDASFIQLAPCPASKAPAFVAKNLPVEEDAGLLVFNIGVTHHMGDAEYAAYAKGMLGALSPWGDRGLWVELETVRGETFSTTTQLRVHRAAGSQLRSMVMMTIDQVSGNRNYVEAVADFLATAPTKK